VWCEAGVPDIGFAREFVQAVHASCPGKLLACNCSASFHWKKNLNDSQIASFQEELSALGYKYQFITLAGIHINWFNTFQFAHAYARGECMKHYVNMVQEPEFAARDKGYTFVSHQQEVGAGYLDDKQIASFQDDLSALGYKYQFITLAGIHINWFNTFQFAHNYARGQGMKHYTEMVQEPEFAAREKGYTFVSHQQEVGAGYFDDVTTVIQGGSSSVKALTGSTEEEQFH